MRSLYAVVIGLILISVCDVVLCTESDNAAIDELFADEDKPALLMLKTSEGAISAGLAIQTGYEFLPDADVDDQSSFVLPRARFFLDGFLFSKQIVFHLSGDAISGIRLQGRRFGPGSEKHSDNLDKDVPFLLDAAIIWDVPLIDARITIGRFVPAWGIMMSTRFTRLGAINYPLYLHGSIGSVGRFRNVGAQAEIDVVDWITVIGGIYNGGKNSWIDDNDAKDFLAGVHLNPIDGLNINASCFFAFPKIQNGVDSDGELFSKGVEQRVQPILEARYQDYGFDIILGGAADIVTRSSRDLRRDYVSFGFLGHLGYTIVGDWLQLFARFDVWEPNTVYKNDERFRLTVGPQFFLDGIHAQIRINYLYDYFGSVRSMCRNYIEAEACYEPGADAHKIAPSAKRNADTLMIYFAVDI